MRDMTRYRERSAQNDVAALTVSARLPQRAMVPQCMARRAMFPRSTAHRLSQRRLAI